MITSGAGGSGESGKLPLVVFTAGPLTAINRVFFERLTRDPQLELSAIIVDDHPGPRGSQAAGAVRGLRTDGFAWFAFRVRSTLGALLRMMAVWLFERMHRRSAQQESYRLLQRSMGIRVYRMSDIQSEASLALIRSLRPHLGVIVGSLVLGDDVLTIPEHGVLSLHKGTTPGHGHDGLAGYWESLAGDASVDVAVHHMAPRVNASATRAAEATIPIEICDTLESLQIKADLVGARILYHAIRSFASGMRQGIEKARPVGPLDQAPHEVGVWRIEQRMRRRAAMMMPALRRRTRWPVSARLFLQYIVLLPMLLAVRNRLIRRRLAPICIFFYHVVANSPVNHLCLPLEEFVRQIEFLRRYYTLVSLPEAVAQLRSGKNDRIAASITFDDGYRDNVWALEYLRYFEIPACFFVSVGHIRDATAFEHDRRRGFEAAQPMSVADLRQLASDGFVVGSHGIYHEDFGRIDPATAERTLRESGELITQICGRVPEHFSFPKGHPENMTSESVFLAMKYYPYVYSAHGGYCFPHAGRRHFPRTGHPTSLLELAMVMDGYTGLRACLSGYIWGLKTDGVGPYAADINAASREA